MPLCLHPGRSFWFVSHPFLVWYSFSRSMSKVSKKYSTLVYKVFHSCVWLGVLKENCWASHQVVEPLHAIIVCRSVVVYNCWNQVESMFVTGTPIQMVLERGYLLVVLERATQSWQVLSCGALGLTSCQDLCSF